MRPGPTHCFNYVDCDIPAGMTIVEWKRERATTRPVRRGVFASLLRRGR